MLRTLIVDDELHCQDRLSTLLQENFHLEIELAGIASSVEEAKQKLLSVKPQLVFLDVHLHDKMSFDLLRQLPSIDFKIIFTTSFEKYALEAFKFSAVDYLMKPVELDTLRNAIEKVKSTNSDSIHFSKMENLLNNMNHLQTSSKKICVATSEEIHFVSVADIIRCESDVNYTKIFISNQKKLTASKTLKEFDEMLSGHNFFRVHQSHLINLNHIKSYKKGKGGTVVMLDGAEVEVSTRKKEEFLKRVFEGK